ncbi:MAG: hypothetical protein V1728_02765 [Candidatus Micrarchaeota archaeon]
MHQEASITDVLGQLSARLASIESRLDAIEEKLHGPAPAGPMLSRPSSPSAVPVSHSSLSQAAFTMSGSSTPASVSSSSRDLMLAPADEQIVNLIRARGAVCAEDVRGNFRYKGKNAASARLSRLYELGILEKQQAGRVVYYRMK